MISTMAVRPVIGAVLVAAMTATGVVAGAPARAEVTSRTFSFGEVRAGDRHQINGRMTFRSDGTAEWSTTTWTDETHSGDIWHAKFLVRSGVGEFFTPMFNSPRMDDGNPSPRYNWGNPFTYDARHYASIYSIIQRASC